jgi:hypothetical protein
MTIRFVALGVILVLAGCGPKSMPAIDKQYPVRGKIVFAGGQPLQGGQVYFYPVGESTARKTPAYGFPGKDGSFQLTAFKLNDGLAPGRYKVVIAPKEEGEPRGSNAASIPKTYQSRDTTPLQVEIQAEETLLDPFILK